MTSPQANADVSVIAYTDGACKGNPGLGGWGVYLLWKNKRKELFGVEEDTTNNRMEMLAAIRALEEINVTYAVEIYTDSSYLQQGISKWISAWKQNGWKGSNKKVVKNADLWKKLDGLCASRKQVSWHWVKGHADCYGNLQADALANKAIDEFRALQLTDKKNK